TKGLLGGGFDDEFVVGMLHEFQNADAAIKTQKYAQRRDIARRRRCREKILIASRHDRALIRTRYRQGRPIFWICRMKNATIEETRDGQDDDGAPLHKRQLISRSPSRRRRRR